MSLEVITEPTLEPITLVEAKDFCRASHLDHEDEIIDSLIKVAREEVEHATGRKLLTTTLKYTLDKFPYWALSLPGGNIQEINSFTYLDKDGASQTVSASLYDAQLNKSPAILLRKSGYSWPTVYENGNAVIVNYDAGWATPQEIPSNLILAVKALVLFYYNNRDLVLSEIPKMPTYIDSLLFKYRIYGA